MTAVLIPRKKNMMKRLSCRCRCWKIRVLYMSFPCLCMSALKKFQDKQRKKLPFPMLLACCALSVNACISQLLVHARPCSYSCSCALSCLPFFHLLSISPHFCMCAFPHTRSGPVCTITCALLYPCVCLYTYIHYNNYMYTENGFI
jgi:hypothetical protein